MVDCGSKALCIFTFKDLERAKNNPMKNDPQKMTQFFAKREENSSAPAKARIEGCVATFHF